MWQWIIPMAFALYVTTLSHGDYNSLQVASSADTLVTVNNELVGDADAQLALTAMDRQCGSCHHPDRSTNKGALAIFDLADECWYCPLSQSQAESLQNRIKSPSFSENERMAIAALLNQLSADK